MLVVYDCVDNFYDSLFIICYHFVFFLNKLVIFE